MKAARQRKTVAERALALHKKLGGMRGVHAHAKLTPDTLPLLTFPGVRAVASFVAAHPEQAGDYTARRRTVAVVSDGSAVQGLGVLTADSVLPVLESRARVLREFGGIDAVPIALATHGPAEFLTAIRNIAPGFGAVVVEDTAASVCVAIEQELSATLDIPVLCGERCGAAVAVLAGLRNAHTVVRKDIAHSRIVVVGAGVIGTAIVRLLLLHGVGDVILVDKNGILGPWRTNLTDEQETLACTTNKERRTGGILEAMTGADVFIGVSSPHIIRPEYVRMMAQRPIVFALAEPEPEIAPEAAYAAGAAVVATACVGDTNRITGSLVVPGMMRGVLEHGVRRISDDMLLSAASKLAALVRAPKPARILPDLFDKRLVKAIAGTVR